jgi:hypothetical protein
MAHKAGAESTTDTKSSGPPTTVFVYPRGGKCPTIAIGQLARPVAALPLHHFVPLNDAFTRAKDRLGSYSLAAHDFTQYARARRLTLAVRVIWPDHTEQAFILRPTFWRWYEIYDGIRPSVDGAIPSQRGWATVRQARGDPTSLLGRWHFFVGRRRFDRLYSGAAPSKLAAQELPRERQPEGAQELIVLSDEPQFEPAPKWRPEQAEEWLREAMVSYPQKPEENKNAWARRLYDDHMKGDFGDDIPWSGWETLRRYMNFKTRTKKIFDQDS